MSARVELYRETVFEWAADAAPNAPYTSKRWGKWRWRFVSNGRTMADSGQGYSRRIDCLNGAATVLGGEAWNGNAETTYIERGDDDIAVVDLTRAAS